jgi:hypothetical protein
MSDNAPQFGKRIVTTTYYEGDVVKEAEEIEIDKFTDKDKLFKDVIDTLALVTKGQTTKVTLEVSVDKQQRYRVVRRYKLA